MLEKYSEVYDKVSKTIKNRFGSEPIYKKWYLTTKIKSYERKTLTNFHVDKIPKEGSQSLCFAVMLINSVFRTRKG